MKDIVTWAESQYGFYVDRQYLNGKWLLQPGPIRLADYHAAILRHCFTPNSQGRLPYDTVLWAEPAKSGKSAIAGLVAEYMALHGEQNSQIILASNKQSQAKSLMFKSLVDSVELNPALPNVEPNKLSVTFANGNEVKAIPSNSRGEAGARFALAVFDEMWGYIFQDLERLWSEFKVDPTRLNSVRMCVGYGGYLESKLWLELLQSGLTGQPVPELASIKNNGDPACWRNGRTFTFWSHETRQPWQTKEWLAGQRKTLRPAEYERMILCRFVEGIGNFCSPEDWQALINDTHQPLPPGSPQRVFIGLDLATAAGGDDAALGGVYSEGGQVKIAFHQIWKGRERRTRLKLTETVQPYLLRKKQEYNLAGLWYDPYQALALTEQLQQAGIRCIPVQQTHSSRAPKDTALLELVNNRRLVLYDHSELKLAASGANVKELGNGLIFLRKASGRSKIDLLIALSNVASEATHSTASMADLPQDTRKASMWDINSNSARSSRWNVDSELDEPEVGHQYGGITTA